MRLTWDKTFITVIGLALFGCLGSVGPATADDYVPARITVQQAVAAALLVQPGTVIEVDLESEFGRPIYEIEIAAANGRRYKVMVDGDTAQVLQVVYKGGGFPLITGQQAVNAALAAQPGVVTEVELGKGDRQPVYEVHITAADGRRYEVDVDGDTAQVLMVIYKGGGTPLITAQQAVDAALLAQPGVATELELGKEYNRPVYEVHITAADGRRFEVMVDGDTAQVLLVLGKVGLGGFVFARISLQQAMTAALGVRPGTVTSVELESKDGRAIYDVRIAAGFGLEYEVRVDANTAQILRVKVDD